MQTPNDTAGTRILWDVTNVDTAKACHYGNAELRYYNGAEGAERFLIKRAYQTSVSNALGAPLADAPESQRDWLVTLFDAADAAHTATAAANLKALSVTITPTQSGSGDPSPTNIRPISGAFSVAVTRTGAGGTNSQTVTVSFVDGNNSPLTVYAGTPDVTYRPIPRWGFKTDWRLMT